MRRMWPVEDGTNSDRRWVAQVSLEAYLLLQGSHGGSQELNRCAH